MKYLVSILFGIYNQTTGIHAEYTLIESKVYRCPESNLPDMLVEAHDDLWSKAFMRFQLLKTKIDPDGGTWIVAMSHCVTPIDEKTMGETKQGER